MKFTTISKLLLAILLVFSSMVNAQTLAIVNGGNTGTSGTNWSITGTTLTVTGAASIDASVIENALANGNLSVLGTTTNFAVTVSEAINATTVGNGLTIGSMTNAGAITVGADISLAGGIAIMGGDVQLNGNITSTATGDLFFQGLSDAWSIRLATGKTIEKTAGTGLLTMQGNGRINNSTSVGSILASGSARLDVVIINEMDDGTAGLYNVSTGNITTNGGHLWISAGAKTRVWNGFSVGSTGIPGNTNYNGIDVTGNISTNGGDILLWAFVGSTARGNGYGDITALSTNRSISSGSGDITLMTRYNDFVNGSPDISISTTGTLSLAPANSSSFDVGLSYAGTTTSGTFTGSGGMDGLIIQNMTSLPALVIGTYLGTGVSGDSPYTSSNTATITLAAAISIAGPITINGGIILAQQNITSTLSGADILLQATGYIDLAASRTIETNNGDISFRANSGGTPVVLPNNTTGAITLNSGSSLLSTGGTITLGGNYDGTEGAGLYAASARVGGAPGILISNATLNAAGGNINIYGSCSTSYDDGIRLQANISTTGVGNIGIYGDAFGGLLAATNNVFFGGITFISAASIIETDAGNINIEATLTNTQSNGTYALNFYRTAYSTGTRGRDIQLLSRSGNIQVTGDPGSTAAGGMGSSSWGDIYAGSPADASFTASGSVTFTYSRFVGAGLNGIITKTTGAVTYEPVSTSFSAAQTFPNNAYYTLASSASSLTIGKPGNTGNITIGTAQTVAGPVSIYGGTVALTGAVTATNSTLTLGAATALTQAAAISAGSLLLSGAGTFTLSNTGNNVATIAGGTSGSRLGSLSYTDASGGLTIGTVGSTIGIYTTGALSVETLTGDINLTESVSSSATTSTALTINAGKSSAIGTSSGGNILVSGTPTVTVGTNGIGRLFSGLETNSTGLTTLAGGSGNVRYGYDETTTTFSPLLAGSTIHAIYRTNTGNGDLTIVASGGDAINSTWSFDNGTLTTTNATVNVNASVIQDYLNSGPLTIEAGNVTISSAISSSAANAFVINSNGVKTITVNAAVSLGGTATFNANGFALGGGINISTSTASDITINTNAGFSTSTTTRSAISSAGGNIVIHADKDANASGVLDLDFLTLNPAAGNTIIRGETVGFLVGSGQMPYINGTGSFTFESSDASFGQGMLTSWFFIDQDNNGIGGLTIGKVGSTANIEQNTNFTVAGPVNYYGGYVNINGTLTSSGNYDILLKGITNTNASVHITSGGITKIGGTGTLTMQGNGRTYNAGTISATGTGVLNVIMWSDFDGDNVGGGASNMGTISTNGGHVWMGGSNSNGGSYSWNGLAVGDGPSVGASGANANALDMFGPITTNGGDLLLWAGNGNGGVNNGIVTNAGWELNVGNGDVVFITPSVLGAGPSLLLRQNGGTFTLVPNGTSFPNTLNWYPVESVYNSMVNWNFPDEFNYLWIENPATLTNLSIGRYDGMTSGGVPVVFTNTSNINFNLPTTIAGSMSFYGGALALSSNLTTTNTTTGNILLSGTTISGAGNIAPAAGRTATINISSASTYDGILSGSGSAFTKLGAGMLTLTKDHTYSGPTVITVGNLQIGSGGSVSQASSGTIASTSSVSVASGVKLILAPNENVLFAAPISGDGGVEIKGMSGRYLNTWLSGSPTLFATNTTVLETLTRITGGLMGGTAIGGGSAACGAYQKSYTASANTGTLQLQVYNGVSPTYYTKCVFVKLTQSGSNVMIQVNTTILGSGAGYRSGNVLGTDISVGGSSMGIATSAAGAGYGISEVYMSGKVNFTGNLTYSGNTVLSNTVTSVSNATNISSYTSKGTQEITDASSSFPGAIVNNGLVILNRTTPLTIIGDMSGTEDVLQVGAAVTMTGTNTHTGTTTIDKDKTLNIGAGASAGSMTGNIVNYGALTFNRTGSSSYPGVISGSGSVTKSGSDDLTMNNLNTYTGATTINAGSLILEQDVPTTSSISYSGAGTLVIQPSSASFTNAVSYPISGFNVSSSIGGLTIGKSTNTANITFGIATTIAGPITAYGGTIAVNSNLTSTATTGTGISLNGQKIIQNDGIAVTTSGANIDYLASDFSTTAAEDNAIRIGNNSGARASINAGAGNVSLIGSFGTTSVAGGTDFALWLFNTDVITSGTGLITLTGDATNTLSTSSAYGISMGNTIVKTASGAIALNGTGGKASNNSRGIVTDNFSVKILSISGAITLQEIKPVGLLGSATYNGHFMSPSSTAKTFFGADGIDVVSSSSSVLIQGDKINFVANSTNVNDIKTTGNVVIESNVNSTFETAPTLTGLSITGSPASVRLGKTTNTADFTLGSAITAVGPITIYGGTIAVNAALTATNSNINLTARTAVNQTAAITANGLALNGAGNFTLQNAANNIAVIAGGDAINRLGSIVYRDADALEIGSVNPDGLYSSGTILVETENGDITLSQNINTSSTSDDAIILNAGRASAIGKASGGNIIVSGTPTLNYGSGGRAKLFSGSNINSTGLTNLVGGAGNRRTNVDETTATFSPVLADDNAYALYRVDQGLGDLIIVASGGDAENSTWIYNNGVLTTISSPVNVNASDVTAKLALRDLDIQAANITVNAAIGYNTNSNSLILNAPSNSSTIQTNASISLAGPITAYGGTIVVTDNLNTTTGTASGDILLKSSGDISLAASKSITTAGGDVILWADSDGNGSGYVQTSASSSISTGGGNVFLGGGTDLTTGYARGAATLDNVSGSYISGVHLLTSTTINSGGGNITLRGRNVGNSDAFVQAGVMGVGASLNAGSGKVKIVGLAGGSGSANSQGISIKDFDTGWTIQSSNPDSDAIVLSGDASSTSNSATSLGINFAGSIVASGGGGISMEGKAGPATNYDQGLDMRGNILANSGTITLVGQNDIPTQTAIFFAYNPSLGFKAGTSVTYSSSNIILKSNNTIFNTSTNLNTTGTVSLVPLDGATSFGVAQSLGSNVVLSAGVSGLVLGKAGNTANITFGAATSIAGPLTAYGGTINVNQNLNTTAGTTAGAVLLKAAEDIIIDASKSITTTGGDVILWSNSDGQTTNGGAFLKQGSGVLTGGGHIWIGGGNTSTTWNGITVGNGYAVSGRSVSDMRLVDWEAGVALDQVTISSGGGHVFIAGQSNQASPLAAGFINYSGTGTLIDAGSGTVTIKGDNTATGFSFGVMTGLHPGEYSGRFVVKSSNIAATNAIAVEGTSSAGTGDGFLIENHTRLVSTSSSNGGGISITGTSPRNAISVGIGSNAGTLEVLSASGTIDVNVGSYPLLIANAGVFRLGSIASDVDVANSSANVVITSNNVNWTGNVPVRTTGTLIVTPTANNSFVSAFDTSSLSYSGITGLTIGNASNTQNITFGSATTIAGPITAFGGTIAVNAALTATNSNINLTASTAATQTAAITANGLALNGAGTFTLNNVANNIVTIAAGSSAAKIGSLSFVDAAGGLEIGTVNPTGITSTGPIKIETLEGNITLSENLATEDTTADAIILNAGKTAAIGTAAGGDIIVSGTPTVTYGTGGRAKLFSGRNSNSTGLTTLVGGVGNKRVSVDETTVTFSPVLVNNTSYALYRADDKLAATISNFNTINKKYFDGSFTIELPSSDSTGAFTYTSSNTAVATISGTTVTILSAGTSTITANQAADVNYDTASAAATLTVSSVSVLTKGGGISSTNLNYVNKYGQIGGSFGLSANGGVLNAKTPEPSNAETGLVLNLDASNSASYSGTGTTWNDISGNNYNCALSGGVSFATASGISTFNFSSGYGAITLPKTTSMTYFVWAKSSVACSTPYMVLFHSGTNFATPEIGPSLFFRACYNYWNTQDGPGNPFSNGNYSTHGTNWHNYIVVNDAVANTTKLYYDGVLIGSAFYKHSSNTNLTIGNSSNLNAPWKGGIATFKAYNKALTDSEISNLYNSTKGVFGY